MIYDFFTIKVFDHNNALFLVFDRNNPDNSCKITVFFCKTFKKNICKMFFALNLN